MRLIVYTDKGNSRGREVTAEESERVREAFTATIANGGFPWMEVELDGGGYVLLQAETLRTAVFEFAP